MFDDMLFDNKAIQIPGNNNGLYILKANQSAGKTLDVLKETGHGDVNGLFVCRKNYAAPIVDVPVSFQESDHCQIPSTLGKFEYYADIAMDYDRIMECRSITGTEAAHLGAKVVDVHGTVYGPEIAKPHLPETVIPKYLKMYDWIFGQGGDVAVMERKWLQTRWLDFRLGHGVYLVFLMSSGNFVLITHRLLVERVPALDAILWDLGWFVVVFIIVCLPAALVIGWRHRRTQMRVRGCRVHGQPHATAVVQADLGASNRRGIRTGHPEDSYLVEER